MKPILEIQNISKKFRINHDRQPYLSLRDKISHLFNETISTEDFWALKDVSFNVMPGDTIGIIGKNGAGKSTLLKILSRITPPTSGKIISRGRIASLLEVGTGFHPELDGRENVFLNGNILGMKRAEIQKQFDAIVDFAGVEKFIDTPLKHYSSGMQLRLAFAVAAFLEPEILVIDEVLAVGDAEFQKKCMGKMEEVSRNQGRTILFVSHQLGVISNLCAKSVLMSRGQLVSIDSTSHIINQYLSGTSLNNKYENSSKSDKNIIIREAYTAKSDGTSSDEFRFDESISIYITLEIEKLEPNTLVGVAMNDKTGSRIFTVTKELLPSYFSGKKTIKVSFQKSLIAPNNYSFTVACFIPHAQVITVAEYICPVLVVDSGTELSQFEGLDYGSIIIKSDWEI